jgi:hypothetical protein
MEINEQQSLNSPESYQLSTLNLPQDFGGEPKVCYNHKNTKAGEGYARCGLYFYQTRLNIRIYRVYLHEVKLNVQQSIVKWLKERQIQRLLRSLNLPIGSLRL